MAALVRPLFPAGRLQKRGGQVAELDLQGPLDGTAAQRDLGYEPEWTLAHGLTDYAVWLKTHEV